jgi:hypothetical protein
VDKIDGQTGISSMHAATRLAALSATAVMQ